MNTEEVRTWYGELAKFTHREFLTVIVAVVLLGGGLAAPINPEATENVQMYQWIFKCACVLGLAAVIITFIVMKFKLKVAQTQNPQV